MRGSRAERRARTVQYADLGAVIHRGCIPPEAAAELPALYGSFRCTLGYHKTYNLHKVSGNKVTGVCILHDPKHILLFTATGRTIEVLNIAFAIAPPDMDRACCALFRALPGTHVIRAEVPFQPRDLRFLSWTRGSIDHLSIALPDTVQDYESMIGRSTRRRLRGQLNRLQREHPNLTTVVHEPGEGDGALVHKLVMWKAARFHERGLTTYWDGDEALVGRFTDLVRRCGRAHVTLIDDEPAAIVFTFAVGDAVCAMEAAHDPRFADADLGLLCLCDVARNAIREGAKRLDLTSGHRDYKERIGATCTQAWRVAVFRHWTSPILMPRKTLGAAIRRARRRLTSAPV